MESTTSLQYKDDMLSFEGFRNTILEDYKTAVISREVSLLGRREVLTGKAKFGIFGDGLSQSTDPQSGKRAGETSIIFNSSFG